MVLSQHLINTKDLLNKVDFVLLTSFLDIFYRLFNNFD